MMRQTFILLAMLAFSASQTPVTADILRLSDGSILPGDPSPPGRTVERTGPYTVVTYEFPAYGIEDNRLAPRTYDLYSPYFSPVTTPGEPSTLIRTDAINVIDTAAAKVEIVGAEYTDFKIALSPATPPHTVNEGQPTSLDPIAGYGGFKPLVPASELDRFVHRGQGVVRVSVTPVMYSMEDTTLRLYRRISYRVLSDQYAGNNGIMTMSDDGGEVSEGLEFDINHTTLSSGQQPVYTSDVTRSYLIIAHSQYQEALRPFIEWKRALGMNTKAVYSNTWTRESIKARIQQEYAADPQLYYVLFVGDNKQVPASATSTGRIYQTDKENEEPEKADIDCPSDYYYTLVTQQSVPELTKGRIPVSTVEELSVVVNKIITYEKSPTTDTSFYNTAVHMSYLDTRSVLNEGVEPPYNGIVDVTCGLAVSEDVYNYVISMSDTNIKRLYSCYGDVKSYLMAEWEYYVPKRISRTLIGTSGIWNKGSNDFIKALNDGAYYAYYAGHGEPDKFLNPYFSLQGDLTIDKVKTLSNGDKLPVIWAVSCMTANFDRQNIATTFLTLQNGGCVGYLGAANNLTVDEGLKIGMIIPSVLFNGGIFKTEIVNRYRTSLLSPHIVVPQTPRMGELLNLLALDCLEIADRDALHYLGDPSMYMRTKQPKKPDVDISYSNGQIIVNSNDGKINIAFYDLVSGKSCCYSDETASYIPQTATSTGQLLLPYVKICVYGDNSIPYIAELRHGEIIVDDRVHTVSMTCENTGSRIIEVTVTGDTEALENPTLLVVNLDTLVSVTSSLDTQEPITRMEVGSLGNYAVTLYSGSEIVQSNKIKVLK